LTTSGEHRTHTRRYLRGYLGRRKPVGYELLEVPARDGQPASAERQLHFPMDDSYIAPS
jgi:hypothetical protein